MARREEAAALLRRDDATARQAALEQLEALVAAHPDFTQARSDLVVALALGLDDVRVESSHLEDEVRRLGEDIRALQRARAPGDWPTRVNVMEQSLAATRRALQPLRRKAEELERRAGTAVRPFLEPPAAEGPARSPDAVRAEAVLVGVRGDPQAIPLAERLRLLGDRRWATLAHAEYALNGRAPPDTLDEAAGALAVLRQEDATFLRPYVLGARVALRRGDAEGAQGLLDAVVALNPRHALARSLRSTVVAPQPQP